MPSSEFLQTDGKLGFSAETLQKRLAALRKSQTRWAAAPSVRRAKYKTELCKEFQRKGFCNYGNDCCYSHCEAGLVGGTMVSHKTKICLEFHNRGFCKYGQRCQYLHIIQGKIFAEFFNSKLRALLLREGGEIQTHVQLQSRLEVFQRLHRKKTAVPVLEIYNRKIRDVVSFK